MGFSYGGVHSDTKSVTLLRTPISLMPATRDKIIVLPGKRGVLRYKPDIHERVWKLDCLIEGTSHSDLWIKIKAVEDWVKPISLEYLIFDSYPTKKWKAILTSEVNVRVEGVRYGFFTLEFACPDPEAEAV